jgi:Flp pilus assembly pilin Flp
VSDRAADGFRVNTSLSAAPLALLTRSGELEKNVQEVTHMGLLTFRTLAETGQRKVKIKQAMRLAGERKVSQREGPQRQSLHKSHQTPGSHICPAFRPPSPARREVNHMLKLFVSLQNSLYSLRNEEGQTMAEYGVVLAVITLVIVATLLLLSGAINTALNKVVTVLK